MCAELGLTAARVDGRSGVWFPGDGARRDRKVAAIGVRVARGVTMHGFALNCESDLAEFSRIVPCGLPDADVTSLSVETGRRVTIADVLEPVQRHLTRALAPVLADASGITAVEALADPAMVHG